MLLQSKTALKMALGSGKRAMTVKMKIQKNVIRAAKGIGVAKETETDEGVKKIKRDQTKTEMIETKTETTEIKTGTIEIETIGTKTGTIGIKTETGQIEIGTERGMIGTGTVEEVLLGTGSDVLFQSRATSTDVPHLVVLMTEGDVRAQSPVKDASELEVGRVKGEKGGSRPVAPEKEDDTVGLSQGREGGGAASRVLKKEDQKLKLLKGS